MTLSHNLIGTPFPKPGIIRQLKRTLLPVLSRDEACIQFWRETQDRVSGGQATLSEFMPQLSGIDQVESRVTMIILSTPCGSLPALCCGDRQCFEALVRNVVFRGRQGKIPATMGACLVKKYSNPNFFGESPLILASASPYSGLSWSSPDCSAEQWLHKSMEIRLGHESFHYFTQRLLGTSGNRVHDEVAADFCGIVRAFDRFEPQIFDRCLGLEPGGRVGRLANYVGELSVDSAEYQELQRLLLSISSNLALFERETASLSSGNRDLYLMGLAICGTTLLSLGREGGYENLLNLYRELAAGSEQ